HDEVEMFCRDQLTELLKLAHADRLRLRCLGAGINRHDVTQFLARRKFSSSAMSREEHKHPVIFTDPAGVGHLVAERPYDSLSRSILVQQLDNVALLETVLIEKHLLDGIGIVDAILELRPVLIVVDADDHGPALAIVALLRALDCAALGG